MRFILASILVLAIPAGVAAQQSDLADAAPVQLEQSVTSQDAASGPVAPTAATDSERAVESADAPAENAALQDPGSRQWWWIVGAVVVGALIVALVL